MSLSSLGYDENTYKKKLQASVGPADYIFGTPYTQCSTCFPVEPGVVPDRFGFACASLVDANTELLGINRKASKDPSTQYKPSANSYCCTQPLSSCPPISESTRLSNPTCSLRGTGWNRWEWLCEDPQQKAVLPFESLVQNRIVVKDNHRPCIPTPIDVVQSLPPLNGSDDVYSELDSFVCGKPSSSHLPKVGWRAACEVKDT